MKTIGRTVVITCDATGKGTVPAQLGRQYLLIGPTTAGAWTAQPCTQPSTTLGIGLSANWPVLELTRHHIGDAIEGQHGIIGTANQTFAYFESVEAP